MVDAASSRRDSPADLRAFINKMIEEFAKGGLYAVDVPALELAGDSREDVEGALKGHMLTEAGFMGRYERTAEQG